MKINFSYECDHGHVWSVFRDEDAPETDAESKCQDGHPAVTCRKEYPSDIVVITISPAQRFSASRKNDTYDAGLFVVAASNIRGEPVWASKKIVASKANQLVALLIGKTPQEALGIIDRLSFSRAD